MNFNVSYLSCYSICVEFFTISRSYISTHVLCTTYRRTICQEIVNECDNDGRRCRRRRLRRSRGRCCISQVDVEWQMFNFVINSFRCSLHYITITLDTTQNIILFTLWVRARTFILPVSSIFFNVGCVYWLQCTVLYTIYAMR